MARQRFSERGGGIEVDNLNESLRALNRFSQETAKAVKGELREQSKKLRTRAWQRAPGGADRTYGPMTQNIGYSVTNKGAAIRLRVASGWKRSSSSRSSMVSIMEFGDNDAYIPVNRGKGKRGSLRTADGRAGDWYGHKRHKPPNNRDLIKNTGGYMLLPTFRRWLPVVEDELTEELIDLYNATQRQAGVRDII